MLDWQQIVYLIGAGGLGALLTAVFNAWRGRSNDVFGYWRILYETQQKALEEEKAERKKLEERLHVVEEKNTKCEVDQATQHGIIANLRERLERQEKTREMSAWIIATCDGVIKDAGGIVPQLLGYRETELIGKLIDILIPERYREDHHKGILRAKDTGSVRPRLISASALHHNGHEVPVAVSLTATTHETAFAIRAQLMELDPTRGMP